MQIDTGSSDLWVNYANLTTGMEIASNPHLSGADAYGDGEVSGEIILAKLQLGELTAPQQGELCPMDTNKCT